MVLSGSLFRGFVDSLWACGLVVLCGSASRGGSVCFSLFGVLSLVVVCGGPVFLFVFVVVPNGSFYFVLLHGNTPTGKLFRRFVFFTISVHVQPIIFYRRSAARRSEYNRLQMDGKCANTKAWLCHAAQAMFLICYII